MRQDHPNPEVLSLFVHGRLPPVEMKRVSRHLLSGCVVCRATARRLWEMEPAVGQAVPMEEVSDGYDEIFDRVFQKMSVREDEVSRERVEASRLLDELRQHPFPRQHLLIANSARFRNPSLCEILIEESHEAGFQDPSRSFELARLAAAIAEALSPETCEAAICNSLRARAWAQRGNALRIQGNLGEAERAFEKAQEQIEAGEVDSLCVARVLDLQASLRREQRRFAEAAQLLDGVIAIYQDLGQWSLLGRALKQKSMVCGEAGDLEEEMVLLRRALEMIDPDEEPRAFLAARHNLIISLNESGRPREAYALLFHTRPLYLKTGDRMNLLRLRWVEGEVARGLGRTKQAEVAFREVRDAFLELGIDYDAALASLDLASIYALQGRTDELRRLADETLEIFQTRSIHQEALSALAVFCASTHMEKAGAGLVEEVSSYLKQARNHPELQFRPTS